MVEDLNFKSSMAQEKPTTQHSSSTRAHWYSPPKSIKRVFDKFPLTTYAPSALPRRAPHNRSKNILHIFASEDVARHGEPSHNPACLKWQAYLKFAGIDFVTVASNNHASPSGSLPFLIPGKSVTNRPGTPISSGKLVKWTTAQTSQREEDSGMRYEAYSSLLDHRIRSAWLYHLYLDAENFKHVAFPLYISTASSNVFVQFALGKQLQQAARDELVKYMSVIDGQELLDGADKAFESLSTLLGDDDFFFGHGKPGLFDASVFAYTHLLAGDQMEWKQTTLKDHFTQYQNLLLRHLTSQDMQIGPSIPISTPSLKDSDIAKGLQNHPDHQSTKPAITTNTNDNMRLNLIALWAVANHLATTKAQVSQAPWSVHPTQEKYKTDSLLSLVDSAYCCIINFSDTSCGQEGAEIDCSVSIPPAPDQVPIVNLPEILTTARVVVCDIANPKLTLCSEEDCAGGQQWHGAGTPGCVNPGFFIQAVKVDWG